MRDTGKGEMDISMSNEKMNRNDELTPAEKVHSAQTEAELTGEKSKTDGALDEIKENTGEEINITDEESAGGEENKVSEESSGEKESTAAEENAGVSVPAETGTADMAEKTADTPE